MKKISPEVLLKLQNALSVIYWYKTDLRSFIASTIRDATILATQDWNDKNVPKRDLVQDLIRRFVNNEIRYQEDLLALIRAVADFSDFSHLKYLDDGEKKVQQAKEKVAALANSSKGYLTQLKELERKESQKAINLEKEQKRQIRQENLTNLKNDFFSIISESSTQKKGYLFEKFLYNLFEYFDLDPKKSFRISGEQIDGAFSFDGNDYLLEAKWVSTSDITKSTIMEFGGKINEKLDNTLGVFISYNGFSDECQCLKTVGSLKPIFLVTGAEIMMILENRITLQDLLLRKRRHAAQRGEVFVDLCKVSN